MLLKSYNWNDMKNLKVKTNPEFEKVMAAYPDFVQGQMRFLRKLVLQAAEEVTEVTVLEECLKWGEPSFVTKTGSTLRMDWKKKSPEQYAMYFKCTSRLVETFKQVFGDLFRYETTRAIVFKLDQDVPVQELKKCIKATLIYHKVKKEVSLGL